MPKMCIHILWDSTVFLCTPSFSVFPLWFLYLPHSALQQLLSPKHDSLLPGKEKSSAPTERYHLSQCTRKGLGERCRVPPVPNQSLLHNTQQAKQQHRLCPTQMYSSAVPNDIACLPSLPRPLHKELFFQIQIHQYLSARLLPKQTLKKV